MDRLRRPNVGVLLDVGHLKVSAESLGFSADAAVRTMASHIMALHLSDNDGAQDSNQPIREGSWFWPVLSEVLAGADVTSVLEVYRLTAEEAVAQIGLANRMLDSVFVSGGVG